MIQRPTPSQTARWLFSDCHEEDTPMAKSVDHDEVIVFLQPRMRGTASGTAFTRGVEFQSRIAEAEAKIFGCRNV